MWQTETTVQAVVPALGDIRCTWSQVIEVAPQTGLKVAVYPRSLRVVGKSMQLHTKFDTGGRWWFAQPVPHER